MTAVMDRTIASGQPTQPCPSCDGTMPAEAVSIGRWFRQHSMVQGVYYQRTVSMQCPHCGHRDARTERRVPTF